LAEGFAKTRKRTDGPVGTVRFALGKNDGISANFEYIVSGAENGGEVKGIPGHFFDPQGAQTLVTGMVEIGTHSFDAAGDRSGQFRGLGNPGVMAGVHIEDFNAVHQFRFPGSVTVPEGVGLDQNAVRQAHFFTVSRETLFQVVVALGQELTVNTVDQKLVGMLVKADLSTQEDLETCAFGGRFGLLITGEVIVQSLFLGQTQKN